MAVAGLQRFSMPPFAVGCIGSVPVQPKRLETTVFGPEVLVMCRDKTVAFHTVTVSHAMWLRAIPRRFVELHHFTQVDWSELVYMGV